MNAYEMAKAVYASEPSARTFEQDLELHLRHGFVFVTPDAFIIGRPVCKDAPYDQILSPWVTFPNPDSWLAYVAAGRQALQVFAAHMPYELPWIMFERDGRLRFYATRRLLKKVCSVNSSPLPSKL